MAICDGCEVINNSGQESDYNDTHICQDEETNDTNLEGIKKEGEETKYLLSDSAYDEV